MQLALCLYKYFPHGGIQRDLLKIADECVRRGHRVRVYAIQWVGERPPQLEVQLVPDKNDFRHQYNFIFRSLKELHLEFDAKP